MATTAQQIACGLTARCAATLSACAVLAALLSLAGCGSFGSWMSPGSPEVVPVVQNPLFIPVADRELVWNQLVDAMDDYFKIRREERVREIGGALLEGRIETRPTIGSTIFEPWRHDATPGFEKLHGTLQSIRRTAEMRVIPTDGGYLIDLAVYKELEDLPQPENSTVGGVTMRMDNSLIRNAAEQVPLETMGPVTLGWIPLGRDISLEQRILADVYARLGHVGQPEAPRWPFRYPGS
ncbi:MAG: hypothetical protein RIC55_28180 [Pirellulaceae bacterium]